MNIRTRNLGVDTITTRIRDITAYINEAKAYQSEYAEWQSQWIDYAIRVAQLALERELLHEIMRKEMDADGLIQWVMERLTDKHVSDIERHVALEVRNRYLSITY